MDFNCNIQGMEQLKANSEKLAKEARKAASASVLRQAEMVRDAIRTKAPQGPTGNLKRSAIAKLMPEKGEYPPIAIAGIDRRIAPHAGIVEFGSSRAPAHPYFRPAVDETKDKVKENLKNDIKQGIERAC